MLRGDPQGRRVGLPADRLPPVGHRVGGRPLEEVGQPVVGAQRGDEGDPALDGGLLLDGHQRHPAAVGDGEDPHPAAGGPPGEVGDRLPHPLGVRPVQALVPEAELGHQDLPAHPGDRLGEVHDPGVVFAIGVAAGNQDHARGGRQPGGAVEIGRGVGQVYQPAPGGRGEHRERVDGCRDDLRDQQDALERRPGGRAGEDGDDAEGGEEQAEAVRFHPARAPATAPQTRRCSATLAPRSVRTSRRWTPPASRPLPIAGARAPASVMRR